MVRPGASSEIEGLTFRPVFIFPIDTQGDKRAVLIIAATKEIDKTEGERILKPRPQFRNVIWQRPRRLLRGGKNNWGVECIAIVVQTAPTGQDEKAGG